MVWLLVVGLVVWCLVLSIKLSDLGVRLEGLKLELTRLRGAGHEPIPLAVAPADAATPNRKPMIPPTLDSTTASTRNGTLTGTNTTASVSITGPIASIRSVTTRSVLARSANLRFVLARSANTRSVLARSANTRFVNTRTGIHGTDVNILSLGGARY